MSKRTIIQVLVILLTTTLYPMSRDEINSIYKKGMEGYKEKNYVVWLSSMKKLHQALPNNRMVLYNLASGYSLNGMVKEALETLEILIKVDANLGIKDDSDFDNLKGDEDFKRILRGIEEIHKPTANSDSTLVIGERDLHPESVLYDKKRGIFLIGSIHKRKIVEYDRDGNFSDFIEQSNGDLYGVMGMKIDNKRGELWVTTSASKHIKGYQDSEFGKSKVLKYNYDSKELIKSYKLDDGKPHNFDDLVIAGDGNIYVSDSNKIYKIDPESDKLELFLENDRFKSTQGLALMNDDTILLIADWISGIFRYDIVNMEFSDLKRTKDLPLVGVDGIYSYKDRSIITIHNGVNPMRIVGSRLDQSCSRVIKSEILESNHPLFGEPTLGTIVDGKLYYVANSQWKGYDKKGKILPLDKLSKNYILELDL